MYDDQFLHWQKKLLLRKRTHPIASEDDVILAVMLSRAVELELAAGALDPVLWDLDEGEMVEHFLGHSLPGIRELAQAVRDQRPFRHAISSGGPIPQHPCDWRGWRVRHSAAQHAAATAGMLPWQVAMDATLTNEREPRLYVNMYFAKLPPADARVHMADLPAFCLQAVAMEDFQLPPLAA